MKTETKGSWRCKKCGSEDVEVQAFYSLLRKEISPGWEENLNDDGTWCYDCEDHTGIEWKE